MLCYKLDKGEWLVVDEPISASDDQLQALADAGYIQMVSSEIDAAAGSAHIILYATHDKDKPKYYIDVMGTSETLVILVADDFPALIATLKEINPLIALVGLEQRAVVQVEEALRREGKDRRRD